MSKNTNLSFLTDYITADITNGRIGINNASPTVAFDVTGVAKFSSTVTAAGSVGIGTTSPDALLTVAGANQATGAAFNTYGNALIYSTDSFAINKGGALSLGGKYNSAGAPIATFARIHGKKENATVDSTAGYLSFETVPEATATLTERMRINSVGNVGIGTNSPSQVLDVRKATASGDTQFNFLNSQNSSAGNTSVTSTIYLGFCDDSAGVANANKIVSGKSGDYTSAPNASSFLAFHTTNANTTAERMRIISGGSVLFGTTTATGNSTGSSVNVGVTIGGGVTSSQVNNNANNYWSKASGFTSGDLTAHFVNGAYVGGISTNGSTTNYAVASDYRLKEDLKDFVGIDLINKIKTYDYQWKSDKTRMYGVVAHEFAEILSYAVTGQKDGEDMQGVDYSKIVPVLVKAIQELSLEINLLKNK